MQNIKSKLSVGWIEYVNTKFQNNNMMRKIKILSHNTSQTIHFFNLGKCKITLDGSEVVIWMK